MIKFHGFTLLIVVSPNYKKKPTKCQPPKQADSSSLQQKARLQETNKGTYNGTYKDCRIKKSKMKNKIKYVIISNSAEIRLLVALICMNIVVNA